MESRTSSEREKRNAEAAATKEPERHALGLVLGVLRHVLFCCYRALGRRVAKDGEPGTLSEMAVFK